MKKRFLFVLAMLSVLTVTGCKESDSKTGTLSAPQQIMVQSDGERSLIIFDEVKNADYYDIYINNVCVTVKSNGTGIIQFDASKIITLPQKYTIKVKAGSDSYFDSSFTDEYEYNHTSILDAPVVNIDGTTLNWDKIPNAEFYDVIVTSLNPTIETTHRFQNNSFDFSNILANKGEYLFKVRAISESEEYLSSGYSNQVKYIHTLTLETPHNLAVNYDKSSGEMLLSFVTSENVEEFTININDVNYHFGPIEKSKFLYTDDLDNVYIIKLNSFAQYKGININNSTLLNVSVKANTTSGYLKSSDFSNKISCEFVSVLETPRFDIRTTSTTCKIEIAASNNEYLSGFAIYLNEKKYKTLSKDIRSLELPLTEIGDAGIRVQSISNNNNCYSSNLSDVKYVVSSLLDMQSTTISFNKNIISWNNISQADAYYIEIYNNTYRYGQFTTQRSLDISNLCDLGNYNVRLLIIAKGYKQALIETTIQYTQQLSTPSNIEIKTTGEGTYLYFNEDDNAYGYLMYLNNTKLSKLFTSSPINLTPYISEANSYKIKLEAVSSINSPISNSEISTEKVLESIKTLTPPTLTISKENDKYYLNVYINENEKEMASNYEIWINYQSIGESAYKNTKIDITSYFVNAGQYNFMAKTKAIDSPYVKDSNIQSLTYNCIKQLDTVTDIKVTKLADESKYILTFKEQTLAAKYLVTIVKGDDETFKAEFELDHAVADISPYVVQNGVYRVYVKAIALQGSFYTDSATSGNPYRLVKGETLYVVQNITVTKQTGTENDASINLTWDSVKNSSGYQVYVYYNNNQEEILKKSIFVTQSNNPTVDIGFGDYLCLDKEGTYTIQIKAMGDGETYEDSQTATSPYIYVMEQESDFERNTIFMYGNTYNYKIETIDDLKNLLWHHYLYNDDVWNYNTLEYNLKVYCDVDLDALASSISETVSNKVESVATNAEKMDIIAQNLLKQYPELSSYTLGLKNQTETLIQDFCLNEEDNIYIFRYKDSLEKHKTNTSETTNQIYKEKLDIVDTFDQRSSTYVFKIDTQNSIDVTTTEQLFIALQYNRQPNFVGDCEVAKTVYENARFILRQICSDAMSDYDKILQIYNFLTKRITWNNVCINEESNTLRDLYLEGILYNYNNDNGAFTTLDEFIGITSDSEGLAKTFVALCAIEGIDAIKVNGNTQIEIDSETKTINYAWNKVYIDIEDDGVAGKKWYVVDLAKSIQNTIDIKKNNVTTTYQVGLHKYFLITDAKMSIQANSWHKRLGDSTDYVANTTFDYYKNERYSCVYNSNIIVDNANLTAGDDTDVTNALMYAMLKANKKHRVIIDIDAKEYISLITGGATDEQSLSQVTSKITSSIYETARTTLGGQYNCSLSVKIIDGRYIVLAVQAANYSG